MAAKLSSEKISNLFAGKLPSPVQQIPHPLYQKYDIGIYVKRDDLIDSIVSGNKWRKLQYNLLNAVSLYKNHIITFGGAYSNHLPAVAKVCKDVGLKSTAFVRGNELNSNSNSHLQYCAEQGMELIFVDRELYKNKTDLFKNYYRNNSDIYVVDEGGRSELGAKGCEDIIYELPEEYDHIFVCVGTGTTLAGIANAASKKFPSTIINGIVVLKGAEEIETSIRELSTTKNWVLHHDYHFGGYGKTTDELDAFIKNYTEQTGIPTEFVYTGKMFFALEELVKRDYIKKGQKILVVHTGGVFV